MQNSTQPERARWWVPLAAIVAIGLVYALVARFIFDIQGFNNSELLSNGFLIVTPMALGVLSAHLSSPQASFFRKALMVPGIITLCFLAIALAGGLEGAICLIIISPLFLSLSAAGAIAYLLIAKLVRPRTNNLLVAGFVLLPYLLTPLENRIEAADSFHRVENSIDIAAPAPVVWQHIIRVAPIGAAELQPDLIDAIGFPRPVEATLSHEGLGGVRHATFEGGVEFIETVDDWQPLRRLSFGIVPNTSTIPPTTFDEHVTIGGPFFDVLRGTYELQPLGPGRTRLVLHSQQRLSTHLNWYASLWTRYVMSEIQGRILEVIRHRCEQPAP